MGKLYQLMYIAEEEIHPLRGEYSEDIHNVDERGLCWRRGPSSGLFTQSRPGVKESDIQVGDEFPSFRIKHAVPGSHISRQTDTNAPDGLEPPVLRSKIPMFGHFYSLLKDQEAFLPIAAIPILRTKPYAISDPILVQSAYCNKNLFFTPFAVRGSQKIAGFFDEYHHVLIQTNVLPEYFKSLYDGTTAQHIHPLNVHLAQARFKAHW